MAVRARHRTRKKGIYWVASQDGTRTYIATWKEARPLTATNPMATKSRVVEKEAATFDRACLLQAEGQANERKRRGGESQRLSERLGEQMLAFQYFVNRGRR